MGVLNVQYYKFLVSIFKCIKIKKLIQIINNIR